MEYIDIDKLKEFENKKYYFDDLQGDEWNNLLEDIKNRGIQNPICITFDNTILAGHQRVRACKILGIKEVPCYYIEQDEYDDDKMSAYYVNSNIEYLQTKKRIHCDVQFGYCFKALVNRQKKINSGIHEIKKIYYSIHRKYVADNRAKILKKYKNRCSICNNDCTPILHVHFRIPLEEWGNSENRNLKVVCPNCHGMIHQYLDHLGDENIVETIGEWIKTNMPFKTYYNFEEEIEYYIMNRNKYSMEKALKSMGVVL